jgi:WD40 repeat protein
MAFSPQSDLFAASRRGGEGRWLTDLLSLKEGESTAQIPTSKGPSALAFDPQVRRLAVASTTLEVWPLAQRIPSWRVNLTNNITCVAWSQDGEHLVVVANRNAGVVFPSDPVLVLNATDGRIEHSVLLDAGTGVQRAAFHPDGQSIVLTTWSGELLWIPFQGKERRLVFESGPGALAFSSDDRRLAFAPSKSELGLLDVATSEVWYSWPTTNPPAGLGFTITTSDDGRWLVTANNARVQLWDMETRGEIDTIPIPVHVWFVTVAFGPGDTALYYSALSFGVRRVELLKSKAPDGRDLVRFGRVEQIGEPRFGMDVIAPDGRSLIVGEHRAQRKNENIPQTMWLWADGDPARARKLTEGWPVAGYRLLRGERWGITTDRVEPDLWIWDAQTGERVRRLGFTTPVLSEPAPNGQWVVTKDRNEFSVWRVGDWTRINRWPAHADEIDTFMAVSPDSRLLATIATHGDITLRTLPAGEELLRLPPPQTLRIVAVAFSPDASRLFLLSATGQVFEWNLAALRVELANLRLDWQ